MAPFLLFSITTDECRVPLFNRSTTLVCHHVHQGRVPGITAVGRGWGTVAPSPLPRRYRVAGPGRAAAEASIDEPRRGSLSVPATHHTTVIQ